MALTRKLLKSMGIEDDKIDQIIDAHTEVTDSLKAERDEYKAQAEKMPAIQKELDELKADGGQYKEKYETEKSAHDALKAEIASKAEKTAKEAAVKAYYESKGITGANLNIAMRGTKPEEFELDGEKLKDTKVLDELIAGDYASLVSKEGKKGAESPTPPTGKGAGGLTKEDIMKISDRNERRAAIAENMNLFVNDNKE